MAGLVRRSKDWQSSWQLAVTEIIIARPELAVGTGRSKSGSRVKRHQKLKIKIKKSEQDLPNSLDRSCDSVSVVHRI